MQPKEGRKEQNKKARSGAGAIPFATANNNNKDWARLQMIKYLKGQGRAPPATLPMVVVPRSGPKSVELAN